MDILREWLLNEIENLEKVNEIQDSVDAIAFTNGRILQCHKMLHELYKLSNE